MHSSKKASSAAQQPEQLLNAPEISCLPTLENIFNRTKGNEIRIYPRCTSLLHIMSLSHEPLPYKTKQTGTKRLPYRFQTSEKLHCTHSTNPGHFWPLVCSPTLDKPCSVLQYLFWYIPFYFKVCRRHALECMMLNASLERKGQTRIVTVSKTDGKKL